jgi:SAM-dependent methyltransferase
MPKVAQFMPDSKSLKSDKGINLEIFQCSGCGLVQITNDPVPYYKEVIRAADFSEEMKDFRLKQFVSFVQKYSLKGKKVIEIGCGSGEYLSIFKQAGVDTYGLEYSDKSVKHCVKKGLKVSKGFIQSGTYKLKHAPFAAFYILNFLEHLPDPNSTLKGIYNNLEDGGVGIVEVPNLDMILRNKLFSEFMRDHLSYFTKETISLALTLNGFKVIECSEVWHEYVISAIVKKREKLDISEFYKHKTQLKGEIEEYLRKFRGKRVAIWGAGHQALAIISLLDLTDRIKYVVDSAVFKQGKYTPVTHIPIVSPDTLVSDSVDAVIVMAASYSDEVTRIIQQKFARNMDIAILRDYGLEIVS